MTLLKDEEGSNRTSQMLLDWKRKTLLPLNLSCG
jgi:hypothetical protein